MASETPPAIAKALDGGLNGADPASLDAVADLRRKRAHSVIALTQRLSRIAILPRGLRAPRNAVIWAFRVPAMRTSKARSLAGLDDRAYCASP